jgi:tRNA A37 threonylcarbamoyladenosine biosynthesis protein TsaE
LIVEWPERTAQRMPDNRLVFHFTMDATGQRFCTLEPFGAWTQRLRDLP